MFSKSFCPVFDILVSTDMVIIIKMQTKKLVFEKKTFFLLFFMEKKKRTNANEKRILCYDYLRFSLSAWKTKGMVDQK